MIIGTAAGWLVHEAICLATGHHDELITRVVGRWRRKHRLLVDGTIYYLAGHLTEIWARDPLSTKQLLMRRLLGWLEFRALIEKVVVRICLWCDCSIIPTTDADDEPHGPIMTPAKWPPELDRHE